MAVGFSSFVVTFPEFAETSKELVDAKLVEARLRCSEAVFGDKYDLAVSYLAAHLLSSSPMGQHARLVPANAKVTREDALTTYERMYLQIRRECVVGIRVPNNPATS